VTTTKKKAAPAAAKPQAGTAELPTNGNGSTPTPKLPGEKGFDWKAEYPDEKVFIYKTPADQKTNRGNPIGGQTIGLAAIGPKRQPSVGFLRRVRHKQEFDQVVDMIELVASENALLLLDEWNPSDLQLLFEQWNEWSHTTVGEA
jgi:hypothetical protein